MRTVAILVLALVTPLAAQAADVGVGTTVNLRRNLFGELLEAQVGYYGYSNEVAATSALLQPGRFYFPSVDIRIDETVIQLHLLETIDALVLQGQDPFYFGGNAFTMPWSAPLADKGKLALFGGIGGSIDAVVTEDFEQFSFGVVTPIGARFGKEHRVALYALPGLDLVGGTSRDGVDLEVASANLLLSAWF